MKYLLKLILLNIDNQLIQYYMLNGMNYLDFLTKIS